MSVIDLSTDIRLSEGNLLVKRTQDCDPIARDAMMRQREGMTGSSDMKHAARIPLVFIEKYCNDNNIAYSEFMQNKEHIKRLVNDPALAHFRIWRGKL